MSEETAERRALRQLVDAIQDPDAFQLDVDHETGKATLAETSAITAAIIEARRVLKVPTDEDREGFPVVTLRLPLRSARAHRDALHNTLVYLRGMRMGAAGLDVGGDDLPERGMSAELRDLANRLDGVVEPALADFEGPHEMPF